MEQLPDRIARLKTASPARAPRAWLIWVVMIAVCIRLGWAIKNGQTIEQEGAEYARIAENLLNGRGYAGTFNNGLQLNFPPLYPLMIAAVSLLTGSTEWAARAINIAFGAALIVPMARLGEWIYGQRTAIAIAVLVALHPLLIAGSASTYSEVPYLTLMVFAFLQSARWIVERRTAQAAVAGLVFGLAYLIRPEAFLFVLVLAAGTLSVALARRGHRTLWKGSMSLLITFMAVAAPNVIFLTVSTGQFRIEAKGTLAYQWGTRMNKPMSYEEAANGIGSDLSEEGVFMRPNRDVITSTHYTAKEYLHFAAEAAKKNVSPIIKTLTGSTSLSAPWLFALAALGLFRSAWDRQRALVDGLLVVSVLIFVAVLFSVQALWLRYFYAAFGLMLFWCGKGSSELHDWARDTVRACGQSPRLATATGLALQGLMMMAVLLTALRGVPTEPQFLESRNWERRDAGLWLARQDPPGRKRVMALDLRIAFYAGADLIYLPYAESDVALRYIAKKNPDYIVLLGSNGYDMPYSRRWVEEGIPDPRAQLVYSEGGSLGRERVKIFKWLGQPPG